MRPSTTGLKEECYHTNYGHPSIHPSIHPCLHTHPCLDTHPPSRYEGAPEDLQEAADSVRTSDETAEQPGRVGLGAD